MALILALEEIIFYLGVAIISEHKLTPGKHPHSIDIARRLHNEYADQQAYPVYDPPRPSA
jgi:hypothetical protein